jgi:hypothetical protein
MRLALRCGGGHGQSTRRCAPHSHGLCSPPDKRIASAAVITTRSNRALSRLKSAMQANNSASTRILVTLVIVAINSSLRTLHEIIVPSKAMWIHAYRATVLATTFGVRTPKRKELNRAPKEDGRQHPQHNLPRFSVPTRSLHCLPRACGQFVFLPVGLSGAPKRRASPFDIHLRT